MVKFASRSSYCTESLLLYKQSIPLSIQILTGFRSAHIQGAELYHMGQQELGHYPIHFHRTYDVDEVGGYDPPSYVRQLSIHHTLSRCVTLHAADGLLVSLHYVYITFSI